MLRCDEREGEVVACRCQRRASNTCSAPTPAHPGAVPQLLDKVDGHIRKQPRVSGNYEQILGRSLEGLVTRAEQLKTKWQVRGGRRKG